MTTGFLAIMTTTRNPALDDAARGACLGAEGTTDRVKHLKVRFGDVGRNGNMVQHHVAFGLG